VDGGKEISTKSLFLVAMVVALGYSLGLQQSRGEPEKEWCWVEEGTLPDPCQPCSDHDCPACVDGVCSGNHKVCAGADLLPDYVLKQESGSRSVTVTSIRCYCIWNCGPRDPNDPNGCGPGNPCEPVDGTEQCSRSKKPAKYPSGECGGDPM
jgi:hypothetical protein